MLLRAKRCNAISVRSTRRWWLPGSGFFVGGLSWAPSAKSLRAEADGKVVITDGPYLETKEHVGGFWVLEVANLDDALPWGRKAAVACPAPA
jgi:hypothetical protein